MPQWQATVQAARPPVFLIVLLLFLSGCSGANRSAPSPVEDPIGPNPIQGLPSFEDDEAGGRAVRRVLSQVRRNLTNDLEALTASGALAVVDRDRFYDYPRFEEELTRFLSELGELRMFVREVDVQVNGDRAVMLMDAQMVFAGRVDPSQRGERRSQVQFDFIFTEQGWRITEIRPRTFFLP